MARKVKPLTFSERRDRFLVATTLISALVFILQRVLSVMIQTMENVYVIGNDFLWFKDSYFAGEHLYIIFLVAAILSLLGKFLMYCVVEAKNFAEKRYNPQNEKSANNRFAIIFLAIKSYLVGITIVVLGTTFQFDRFQSWVIFSEIVFFLIVYVIKRRNQLLQDYKKVIKPILKEIGILCCVAFFVFMLFMYMLITIQGSIKCSFDEGEMHVEFESNHIPDKIAFKIEEEGHGNKEFIVANRNEIMETSGKIIVKDTNQVKEKISLKQLPYTYNQDVDLTNKLAKGRNIITLIIEFSDKIYEIRTEVNVTNKYEYAKQDINLMFGN